MRDLAKKALAAVFLLALGISGAVPAAAQENPKGVNREQGNLPIEITADRVSADSVRNSMMFEGNVVARQGDVTMYSSRLHAAYSQGAGAIERIEAEGNVRFVREGREARAPRATLFNLEQRVVLSGGAFLQDGENTLQGETLTIYLQENRSVVTGSEGGGRVQAVIVPKGAQGKPPK